MAEGRDRAPQRDPGNRGRQAWPHLRHLQSHPVPSPAPQATGAADSGGGRPHCAQHKRTRCPVSSVWARALRLALCWRTRGAPLLAQGSSLSSGTPQWCP